MILGGDSPTFLRDACDCGAPVAWFRVGTVPREGLFADDLAALARHPYDCHVWKCTREGCRGMGMYFLD